MSAGGVVVAHIAVGESMREGELVDPFGRPDVPVEMSAEDGLIRDLKGGTFAEGQKCHTHVIL